MRLAQTVRGMNSQLARIHELMLLYGVSSVFAFCVFRQQKSSMLAVAFTPSRTLQAGRSSLVAGRAPEHVGFCAYSSLLHTRAPAHGHIRSHLDHGAQG